MREHKKKMKAVAVKYTHRKTIIRPSKKLGGVWHEIRILPVFLLLRWGWGWSRLAVLDRLSGEDPSPRERFGPGFSCQTHVGHLSQLRCIDLESSTHYIYCSHWPLKCEEFGIKCEYVLPFQQCCLMWELWACLWHWCGQQCVFF